MVEQTLKPIDSPNYGYWSALWRVFVDKAIYLDVAKRWKGYGLLYLFFLLSLFSIPFFVLLVQAFNQQFKIQVEDTLRILPAFSVQQGEVKFDRPMPYLVKNTQGQVVAIIDTTGKITKFDSQYPNLSWLVTKNTMQQRIPVPQLFGIKNDNTQAKVVSTPFDKQLNAVIDGKQLVKDKAVQRMKWGAEAFLYPLVVFILWGFFAPILLALAYLGKLFSLTFFHFTPKFAVSSRLMMLAATPMLLVFFLFFTFNKIFPGFGLVLLPILIVFYSYGLFNLKYDSQQVIRR